MTKQTQKVNQQPDRIEIQIKTSDNIEEKIEALRAEFENLRKQNEELKKKDVSTGFVSGNQNIEDQTGQKILNPIEEKQDTFIFGNRQNPPVTQQITNLDVLTKITDPSKLLLTPQSPSQNPNDLYVTVVRKNKAINPIFNVEFINSI